MSEAPFHYWAACEKAIFQANVKAKDGKSYYKFHGGEAIFSGSVGDVVRHCAEGDNIKLKWVVFRFVPVPSSMLDALWAAQHDEPMEKRAFEVRVHEKFSFPEIDRGNRMSQRKDRVKIDTSLTTDDAPVKSEEGSDTKAEAESPEPKPSTC